MTIVDERIRLGEFEFSDHLRAEKDHEKSQMVKYVLKIEN